MKSKLTAFLIVAMVAIATPVAFGVSSQRETRDHSREHRDNWNQDSDYAERDEINQSYQLQSGAVVEVRGINGTVDVETHHNSTAEVHVVRSARNRDDLNYRKVIIEYAPNRLIVRGENEKNNEGERNRNVRQRVTLKLPRSVDLGVSGINGRTTVGEVDGPVKLSGINGKVVVGQAVGYSNISGINGKVEITISQLSERGIHVSGINGSVDLLFRDSVNADLDATGINGQVNTDMAEVVFEGKFNRQNFKAKIGAGGTPIKVSGVNGSVKIRRAGSVG